MYLYNILNIKLLLSRLIVPRGTSRQLTRLLEQTLTRLGALVLRVPRETSELLGIRRRLQMLLSCLIFGIFYPGLAQAAEITVSHVQLLPNKKGYHLSADFDFNLSPFLQEAINKGLVLHFKAEFELTRSRWYWLDKRVNTRERRYQLNYHALTRKYRISTGSLHQAYDRLEDAVMLLKRLRAWQVIEADLVRPGRRYQASLRFYLDRSLLPRPFQISPLSTNDWVLTTDRVRWQFITSESGDSQ